MAPAAARDRARTTEALHRNPVGIDDHLDGVPLDAGKRDRYQDFGIGRGDIDRRLPTEVVSRLGDRPEELTMQPLGAIYHLAGPGPHWNF
jgi:hypothetical protein